MRDIEHKVGRAIVDTAVECKAARIVIGDVRDIADGIDTGKKHNQRMSRWDHGKVRQYVEYKAQAEGMLIELVDEHYTTKTCPNCTHRHKPRGRNFRCPACGTQAHRDVAQRAPRQINLLARFKTGDVGKLPPPTTVKYRIPHNLRVMRRCRDTGQVDPAGSSVARAVVAREATGF
jgi:putative transposase